MNAADASPAKVQGKLVMPVVAEPEIEEEKDEVVPRPAAAPEAPALAERWAHEVAHLPFKPWCEICVAAKGQGPQHLWADPEDRARQLEADESLRAVIQVDYIS